MAKSQDNNGRTELRTRFVQKHLTRICIGVCLLVLSIFGGVNFKVNTLIKDQLLYQGRAFVQKIILTREWISKHGGVYVRRTPGMAVNPYLLEVPDLKVVVTGEDGEQYILKNPALATREISELADQQGLFQFRTTSLKPLNPLNAPNPFEEEALSLFEKGAKEHFLFSESGPEAVFNYMAPLIAEKNCLRCHASQDYQLGDVRGGIHVSIPATEIVAQMKKSRRGLALSALGIAILICGLLYVVSKAFKKDLNKADQKLFEMATRDFLTGLLNRREAYDRLTNEVARADRVGATIGIILLDIDYFKNVNDSYGHAAGDQVLKTLAKVLTDELRGYDIVSRFGGEEFLVALQDTNLEAAKVRAEGLREAISGQQIRLPDGHSISVTVSIGVAERITQEAVDKVIGRADEALYQAKNAGRDQIVCLPVAGEGGQA